MQTQLDFDRDPSRDCPSCNGTGTRDDDMCINCNGTGRAVIPF